MNITKVLHFCKKMGGAGGPWNNSGYCYATDYATTPGTITHMDHALYANDRAKAKSVGRSTIVRLFERWHGGSNESLTNVSSFEAFDYIEANVLANLLYEERSVKMLVGSFPALYGTARGELLRQWATHKSIALSWSFGAGQISIDHEEWTSRFRGHERLLDDVVSSSLQGSSRPKGLRLNSSVTAKSMGAFRTLWHDVKSARSDSGWLSQGRLERFWHRAQATARPDSMMIALPSPGMCDWQMCLGATRSAGDCVCYT
jgi:hypothetical protein